MGTRFPDLVMLAVLACTSDAPDAKARTARHASCEGASRRVAVLPPIGLPLASHWPALGLPSQGGRTQPMACGPEPSATAWLREVSMTSAHLANLFPSLARQSNPWKPWNPWNPSTMQAFGGRYRAPTDSAQNTYCPVEWPAQPARKRPGCRGAATPCQQSEMRPQRRLWDPRCDS